MSEKEDIIEGKVHDHNRTLYVCEHNHNVLCARLQYRVQILVQITLNIEEIARQRVRERVTKSEPAFNRLN